MDGGQYVVIRRDRNGYLLKIWLIYVSQLDSILFITISYTTGQGNKFIISRIYVKDLFECFQTCLLLCHACQFFSNQLHLLGFALFCIGVAVAANQMILIRNGTSFSNLITRHKINNNVINSTKIGSPIRLGKNFFILLDCLMLQ